jgi:hypothetical protein
MDLVLYMFGVDDQWVEFFHSTYQDFLGLDVGYCGHEFC